MTLTKTHTFLLDFCQAMFAPYVIGFISVCIDAKQDKRLCVECALASAYACISGDWAAILRNMNEH